jgi:hypothetical protein
MMRKALGGLGLALAIALVASHARIAGIDAWKIVLAGVGFVFFVLSGRGRSPSR